MARQRMGESESWQRQYAYLLNLLQSEAGPTGRLGSAAGGVEVRISEVSPPDDVGTYPAIGVQFMMRDSESAGMRLRLHTNTFDITVIVQAGFDPFDATIDRRVKIALEKLLNDENGNGLLPVLYSDIELGGTAITSADENLSAAVGRESDEAVSVSGFARITFVATAEMQYS